MGTSHPFLFTPSSSRFCLVNSHPAKEEPSFTLHSPFQMFGSLRLLAILETDFWEPPYIIQLTPLFCFSLNIPKLSGHSEKLPELLLPRMPIKIFCSLLPPVLLHYHFQPSLCIETNIKDGNPLFSATLPHLDFCVESGQPTHE